MQHRTPCRRYLCRAISPAARGCVTPVPLCGFPLYQFLFPPQPALQHRPATTGAYAAWQVWGGRGQQGVLPLRWCELEERGGWVGSGRVRWGKRGGSWGSHGGDAVRAAGDGRHGAGRVGRGEVLPTAVRHGGQRWQGRGGRSGRTPTSHGQGDPLRGDSVDFGGHGAARGAREGQGGGGQAITIQLSRPAGAWRGNGSTGKRGWEEGKEMKDETNSQGKKKIRWTTVWRWSSNRMWVHCASQCVLRWSGCLYLRRSIGAALWRIADRGVGVLHPILDARSSLHFYVGDGEDALAVGAWDFAFIPVFVDSTDQRDPLALQETEHGVKRFL